MSTDLILYDLPSRGRCACWSLNSWKARLALNYKGIPYKTEWTEYPDIAPMFKEFGIPPIPKGSGHPYSVPAITLPDGTHVMESLKIAQALERLQPEPSLHLDNGYVERTQQIVYQMFSPLAPLLLPRIPRDLLPERSAAYFRQTRENSYGMSLDALEQSDRGGENAWTAAEPGMREARVLLAENPDGPFIAGREPSFADFVLAGMWRFAEVLGRDDVFKRGMQFDASFSAHYEACAQWFKRDDH